MRFRAIVWVIAIWAISSAASAESISRDQLEQMIENGVGESVVLQIVERDCVDFEITPEVLIELSPTVPGAVLEAAIACRTGGTETPRDRSDVELLTEPPLTMGEVKVLAMIPATLDGIAEEALTAAFVAALKEYKPRYDVIDHVELALHFEGAGPFHANAPISSLLAAARAKGAHAVVLVNGQKYRRLEDPAVRLDVKLVEVNQGKVVWSGGDKGISNFLNWNTAKRNASRNTVKLLP